MFSLSLAVKDLSASLAFYEGLGFEVIDGGHSSKGFPDTESQKWRIIRSGEIKIGLFQGLFSKHLLTFHPKDVRAIQETLKQRKVPIKSEVDETGPGPAHLMLEDPDGNPILFDQG